MPLLYFLLRIDLLRKSIPICTRLCFANPDSASQNYCAPHSVSSPSFGASICFANRYLFAPGFALQTLILLRRITVLRTVCPHLRSEHRFAPQIDTYIAPDGNPSGEFVAFQAGFGSNDPPDRSLVAIAPRPCCSIP